MREGMTDAELGRYIRSGGLFLKTIDPKEYENIKHLTEDDAKRLANEFNCDTHETSIEKIVEEYYIVNVNLRSPVLVVNKLGNVKSDRL